ncbi:MAG: MBG domain-containing protein, partial [Christensenellales bacterium]
QSSIAQIFIDGNRYTIASYLDKNTVKEFVGADCLASDDIIVEMKDKDGNVTTEFRRGDTVTFSISWVDGFVPYTIATADYLGGSLQYLEESKSSIYTASGSQALLPNYIQSSGLNAKGIVVGETIRLNGKYNCNFTWSVDNAGKIFENYDFFFNAEEAKTIPTAYVFSFRRLTTLQRASSSVYYNGYTQDMPYTGSITDENYDRWAETLTFTNGDAKYGVKLTYYSYVSDTTDYESGEYTAYPSIKNAGSYFVYAQVDDDCYISEVLKTPFSINNAQEHVIIQALPKVVVYGGANYTTVIGFKLISGLLGDDAVAVSMPSAEAEAQDYIVKFGDVYYLYSTIKALSKYSTADGIVFTPSESGTYVNIDGEFKDLSTAEYFFITGLSGQIGLQGVSEYKGVSAGTYAIEAKEAFNSLNYFFDFDTSAGSDYVVNKFTVTIKAENASKQYGDSDPTIGYKVDTTSDQVMYDGTVINDAFLATVISGGKVSRTLGESVGVYAYLATGEGFVVDSNFTVVVNVGGETPSKFTIEKREIEIFPVLGQSAYYDTAALKTEADTNGSATIDLTASDLHTTITYTLDASDRLYANNIIGSLGVRVVVVKNGESDYTTTAQIILGDLSTSAIDTFELKLISYVASQSGDVLLFTDGGAGYPYEAYMMQVQLDGKLNKATNGGKEVYVSDSAIGTRYNFSDSIYVATSDPIPSLEESEVPNGRYVKYTKDYVYDAESDSWNLTEADTYLLISDLWLFNATGYRLTIVDAQTVTLITGLSGVVEGTYYQIEQYISEEIGYA